MVNKVTTNHGRNALRDFLVSDVAELAVGTDGTEPSKTDTALGNEAVSKAATAATDGTGRSTYTIRLDTTEANTVGTLEELGSKDGALDLLSRLVFAEIDKTSDFEIEFELTKEAQNP